MTLRKETRGDAPESDPGWEKEDALLDFLMFLTKWNHAGLFEPVGEWLPLRSFADQWMNSFDLQLE
jgi:hypothetical protein